MSLTGVMDKVQYGKFGLVHVVQVSNNPVVLFFILHWNAVQQHSAFIHLELE